MPDPGIFMYAERGMFCDFITGTQIVSELKKKAPCIPQRNSVEADH